MSWRTTTAAARAEQNRQVAVIDLGSNSWRLVVFTFGAGGPKSWWKLTDELYETVRIGEGIGATGRLSEGAIARGLERLLTNDALRADLARRGPERASAYSWRRAAEETRELLRTLSRP